MIDCEDRLPLKRLIRNFSMVPLTVSRLSADCRTRERDLPRAGVHQKHPDQTFAVQRSFDVRRSTDRHLPDLSGS